jgi:hypothetical protein
MPLADVAGHACIQCWVTILCVFIAVAHTHTHTQTQTPPLPQPTHRHRYVDMFKNPERWTGYAADTSSIGRSGSEIWHAIHDVVDRVCASSDASDCREVETLRRVVDGFHASVSVHVAAGFCLKQEEWGPCLEFGPDRDEYNRRVGDHPDRIASLRFLYLLMLRGGVRARDILSSYDYDAGDADETNVIRSVLRDLFADVPCPTWPSSDGEPFDESALFQGESAGLSLSQFRDAFREISMAVNCVGCDKCKLWGKLQVEGVGAAMRMLFTAPEELRLERTEVVAYINALHQFAKSVHATDPGGVFGVVAKHEPAAQRIRWPWVISFVVAIAVARMIRQSSLAGERDIKIRKLFSSAGSSTPHSAAPHTRERAKSTKRD